MMRRIGIWMGLAVWLLSGSATLAFTVSGTARDTAGVPVVGVEVLVYDDQDNPVGGFPPTFTDATGFYGISSIPSGTWGLGFAPPSATGLLGKLVSGIVVTGDLTVDVTLERGAVLSGTVFDTLGMGIFNIDLNVYDQITGDKVEAPGDNTDLTGFYDVVVAPGLYRLRWRDVSGGRWVAVEFENVAIGGDTTIDVTMLSGFFVSGTVRDSTGTPVVNADLDALESSSGTLQPTPGDNTDSNGDYQILVPAKTYDITVTPPAGALLLPDIKTGVAISSDTTIDFTLVTGRVLSGFVRDPLSAPVVDVDLDVRDAITGIKLITPGDNTDATGFYDVLVPNGTYDIDYQPPVLTGLAPVRLPNVVIQSDTAIDVVVVTGVHLSGVVTHPLGAPAVGVDLDVKDAVSGVSVPVVGDQTDPAGQFDMIVPVGLLDVEVEPPPVLHLAAQRLPGLSVTADTALSIDLDTGMVVSGVVRDSLGLPVAGVDVRALTGADTAFTPSHTTDLAGLYTIYLAPGTYDMEYHPDSTSGLPDTLLPGVLIAGDTTIDVTYPTTATGGTDRGDVNQDANITSADIIYLVNFVFKGGPPPQLSESEGDTNCDGSVTSADIIFLVNFVFKGGPPPVCP